MGGKSGEASPPLDSGVASMGFNSSEKLWLGVIGVVTLVSAGEYSRIVGMIRCPEDSISLAPSNVPSEL
jgi:hypothetical protein